MIRCFNIYYGIIIMISLVICYGHSNNKVGSAFGNRCYQTYYDKGAANREKSGIDPNLFVPDKTVMMGTDEVKLLCGMLVIYDYNGTVLEWGSGGSTMMFSQFASTWTSIENDKNWGKAVKDSIIKNHIKNVEIHVQPENLPWKSSVDGDGTFKQFSDYVMLPKHFENKKQFDIIIIDGRARVPCAIEVIKQNLLFSHGVVIIHDWNRDMYHKVLKYYTIVLEEKNERGMVVLRPKENSSHLKNSSHLRNITRN